LQQAILSPKITSTIKQFLVQRGSRVKKGQLLAVLETQTSPPWRSKAKVNSNKRKLATRLRQPPAFPRKFRKAELDAAAAKAKFSMLSKKYSTVAKNSSIKAPFHVRDLDAAQVSPRAGPHQYEVAQRQLADLRRVWAEANLEIRRRAAYRREREVSQRRSAAQLFGNSQPIDGVVTERTHMPVNSPRQSPILTVMDTSFVVVKAHVAQSDAASLKVGN